MLSPAYRNLRAPRLFSRGMPGRLATSAALLAALGAVAAAPAAGGAATLSAAPATVRLLDCSSEGQSATFNGRMNHIEGSERMWMRFTLLEKRAAVFERLEAPGLGRWHKSKPGVGGFSYRQIVRELHEGASYRMQVNYRWYAADGQLVDRARRRSVACRQFEQLPNLTVAVVGARPTKVEGVLSYSVRVQNIGLAAARGVAVSLVVDGSLLDTPTVGFLAPGESRLLGFSGPPCTTSVTAAVDPDGVLVESSEDDNVQELACAELPKR